jgi:hypothetical protein
MSEERAVKIYHPYDAPLIAMPNDNQLDRLIKIVLSAYPHLAPAQGHPRWEEENRHEFRVGFRASFERIACLYRTDTFYSEYSIQRWTHEAMDYFRGQRRSVEIRWPVYLAAAIAAGDVPFCVDGPYVGLRFDSVGCAPIAAWQAVLQGRMLRPPSRPPN